jgi:hypothetical protein
MLKLEEFVKSKKPKDSSGKEVYSMCDSMLKELDEFEKTITKKK